MFRNLFQALFGSFFRKQKATRLSEQDRAEVFRMIQEANYIASRDFLSDGTLFHNEKDRRRESRG